jgi:DsbC/DsbD-like thiol-disulfide interchange protein
MIKICQYLLVSAFFLNTCSGMLFAEPVKDAFVEVELITDNTSIQPGVPFWVGLHMDMDDQWQVYWKNPGDSGLPTIIKWDLPDGFKAGEVKWPYPMRMDYPELTTYNYEDEVILLSEFTPSEDLVEGSVVEIKAQVTWLSCLKMCVPGKAALSLELPVTMEEAAVDGRVHEMFKETMNDWPLSESGMDITVDQSEDFFYLFLIPHDDQLVELSEADFFPERNDLVDHMALQVLEEMIDGYRLLVTRANNGADDDAPLKGVLVLEGKAISPDQEGEEFQRAVIVDAPINNADDNEERKGEENE